MHFFLGSSYSPVPNVGDTVDIHATTLAVYNGTEQVTAADGVVVHPGDGDVSDLVQDLSSGIPPSEEMESEVVTITGATVTSIAAGAVTISYGTATGVQLYPDMLRDLCVNATLNIRGVVTAWSPSSVYQVRTFKPTDITNVNTMACGGFTCQTIAEVRASAATDVDIHLCDVTVTYVQPRGFYVQDVQTGPGLLFRMGSTEIPFLAPSSHLHARIRRLNSFNGNTAVESFEYTVHAGNGDVSDLVQDLSEGIPPSEDLESELVKVTGATVTAITATEDPDLTDVTISYGTASGVTMRVTSLQSLCVGATLNVLAVVTEWSPDSRHQIQAFALADFSCIVVTGCTP
jgi:hypothetical protein